MCLSMPKHRNSIYVIDINNMKLLQCKLKCPSKFKSNSRNSNGPMRAICMNNENRDNLMVFGFVNEFQINNNNNNNITNIPHYLINIILNYILTEYIHIFWADYHWKINIDDILSNIY